MTEVQLACGMLEGVVKIQAEADKKKQTADKLQKRVEKRKSDMIAKTSEEEAKRAKI